MLGFASKSGSIAALEDGTALSRVWFTLSLIHTRHSEVI